MVTGLLCVLLILLPLITASVWFAERAELEGRWTCPRCSVRTVRGDRRKMAGHWYCERCAGMYWPAGGEKT